MKPCGCSATFYSVVQKYLGIFPLNVQNGKQVKMALNHLVQTNECYSFPGTVMNDNCICHLIPLKVLLYTLPLSPTHNKCTFIPSGTPVSVAPLPPL